MGRLLPLPFFLLWVFTEVWFYTLLTHQVFATTCHHTRHGGTIDPIVFIVAPIVYSRPKSTLLIIKVMLLHDQAQIYPKLHFYIVYILGINSVKNWGKIETEMFCLLQYINHLDINLQHLVQDFYVLL